MNMGSALETMMHMASSTMGSMGSMASETGMSMGDGMDMGMMSMRMYFSTQYRDVPVLFQNMAAKNKGQAFGIFLFLFVIGFLTRGIEFVKNYLEQSVWKNPTYVQCHPGRERVGAAQSASDLLGKEMSSDSEAEVGLSAPPSTKGFSMASLLFRDAIRLVLCILPDLFGFALMLAAMSYTLTYFFGVVLGLGVGRFFFERLSDRMNVKPPPTNFHC